MSDVRFIAARLDEKMKEFGYTDESLAEKVKMSKTAIYYLRKGRGGKSTTTSADNLQKIADALRTSPTYFVDESADAAPNQKKMSALVADIAGIADELSPLRQHELRDIASAIAKIEKSADVDAIYTELMNLIARLTEKKGGQAALEELIRHIESLASGATSPSVTRRAKSRRTDRSSTESAQ